MDMKQQVAKEIKRRYDDDHDFLGYDQAIRELMAVGFTEYEADNILHPIKEK